MGNTVHLFDPNTEVDWESKIRKLMPLERGFFTGTVINMITNRHSLGTSI